MRFRLRGGRSLSLRKEREKRTAKGRILWNPLNRGGLRGLFATGGRAAVICRLYRGAWRRACGACPVRARTFNHTSDRASGWRWRSVSTRESARFAAALLCAREEQPPPLRGTPFWEGGIFWWRPKPPSLNSASLCSQIISVPRLPRYARRDCYSDRLCRSMRGKEGGGA
jgi:hypothetical protein